MRRTATWPTDRWHDEVHGGQGMAPGSAVVSDAEKERGPLGGQCACGAVGGGVRRHSPEVVCVREKSCGWLSLRLDGAGPTRMDAPLESALAEQPEGVYVEGARPRLRSSGPVHDYGWRRGDDPASKASVGRDDEDDGLGLATPVQGLAQTPVPGTAHVRHRIPPARWGEPSVVPRQGMRVMGNGRHGGRPRTARGWGSRHAS